MNLNLAKWLKLLNKQKKLPVDIDQVLEMMIRKNLVKSD